MFKTRISNKNTTYGIIGLGRFGESLALSLANSGAEFMVIDKDEEKVREMRDKLGAEVVYPEKDMAERLANRLIASQVIDVIQLSEKINISKVMLPDRLEGKTVVDINMRKKFNVNIIAIENNGEVMQVVNPEYVFRNGDILYLSGSSEGLNKFGEWIG